MAKTIAQLHTEAQTIRDETVTAANTATRVGGCIDDVVEYIDELPTNLDNSSDADLDITDENGYVLARFANGHFFTKNFSSAPLFGKKVSFLGDSISTYANYTGSYNPFYTGSNAGITNVNMTWWKGLCNEQGATVNRLYAYGGKEVVNFLCTKYDQLFSNGSSGTSPDVIFVLGGINDWYNNRTLGAITDAEASNGSFYACYKYLLSHLKSTYPNAVIVALTLMNSMIDGTNAPYPNGNGVDISAFNQAIKDCCDFHSVQYIDTNKGVNIHGGNYTSVLADYTHPNATGANMLKMAVKHSLSSLNI